MRDAAAGYLVSWSSQPATTATMRKLRHQRPRASPATKRQLPISPSGGQIATRPDYRPPVMSATAWPQRRSIGTGVVTRQTIDHGFLWPHLIGLPLRILLLSRGFRGPARRQSRAAGIRAPPMRLSARKRIGEEATPSTAVATHGPIADGIPGSSVLEQTF